MTTDVPSVGQSLDLTASAVDLTVQLVDIESVSRNEQAIADAVQTALSSYDHLTVTRHGNTSNGLFHVAVNNATQSPRPMPRSTNRFAAAQDRCRICSNVMSRPATDIITRSGCFTRRISRLLQSSV